jgi:hypothetical protein
VCTVRCTNGHDNPAEAAVCSVCGRSFLARPRWPAADRLIITTEDLSGPATNGGSTIGAASAALAVDPTTHLAGPATATATNEPDADVTRTVGPPPTVPRTARPDAAPAASPVEPHVASAVASPTAAPGQVQPGTTVEVAWATAPGLAQQWHAGDLHLWITPDLAHVLVPTGEAVRSRLRYVGGAWGTYPATTDERLDGRLRPLFDGGGELAITDRRLVGFSRAGTAYGYQVGPHLGRLVCWQLPLAAIAEVALTSRSRADGRTVTGLDVWVLGSRPGLLRIDELASDDRPEAHDLDLGRRAMQAIVRAAAGQVSALSAEERDAVLHPGQARWLDRSYSSTAEALPVRG